MPEPLQSRLEQLSRRFFADSLEEKLRIRMELGGRAWRGYFPVGNELTSGRPDLKEGLYFGIELEPDHPAVLAGLPLHGPNLFPPIAGFRDTVLEYMSAIVDLGHRIMRALALSLQLPADYFEARYTANPFVLFRIFNYPAQVADTQDAACWGVGEHTDYGLLTILKQDDAGGLEVKTKTGWMAARPVPNAFVCNVGDMLDKMTGGLYRSTPHRVRNKALRDRLSFPFFFDPALDARIQAIELPAGLRLLDDKSERWDGASVHEFAGTYGEYLCAKIAKVFPQLNERVF